MRRALIFRRHECLGESVSSNLSLSSDSKRAMHGPPLFFRAHHGRSRLPSRSLSLEKGDGRCAQLLGFRMTTTILQTGLKISFFLSCFSPLRSKTLNAQGVDFSLGSWKIGDATERQSNDDDDDDDDHHHDDHHHHEPLATMGEEAPGGGKGRVAGGAKRSKKKIGTQKGTTTATTHPPPPPPPHHRRRREKEVEVKKEEEDEEDALGGSVSKRTTRRTASTENVEAMNASAAQGGGGGGGGAGRTRKKASPPSPEIVEPKEEEVTEEEEGEEEEEEDMEIDDEEDAQRGVRKIDADEKYEADWTDKKQYFPIDLAVFDARGRTEGICRRTEGISLNDDEKEKESDVNENKEEKRSIAQTLEDMRASGGEKLVAWQLPPDLPLANKRNGSNKNSTARRNNNTNRRGAKRMVAERGGVDNATNNGDRSKKRKKLLEVPDLRAGQLGEILVYADGTAKLVIGECRFDLENGVSYRHHEQFVVIDENKKKCAFIGDIVGRVVATPDVDQLIEQSLKDDSGDDDDDDNDDDDDSEVNIAIRNGYSD